MGEFPTMDSFGYEEEMTFTDLGVPAFVYRQRAWSPDDGELLHLETGLWRCSQDGALAVTIALPRVTEISEGSNRRRPDRAGDDFGRPGDRRRRARHRRRIYELDGDTLRYEIAMATAGVSAVTRHLVGTLRRSRLGADREPSPPD